MSIKSWGRTLIDLWKYMKISFSCPKLNAMQKERVTFDPVVCNFLSYPSIIYCPQALSTCSHSGSSMVPVLVASFMNGISFCCQFKDRRLHFHATSQPSAVVSPPFFLSGVPAFWFSIYNLWIKVMYASWCKRNLCVFYISKRTLMFFNVSVK